jgi:hypothetical protein
MERLPISLTAIISSTIFFKSFEENRSVSGGILYLMKYTDFELPSLPVKLKTGGKNLL